MGTCEMRALWWLAATFALAARGISAYAHVKPPTPPQPQCDKHPNCQNTSDPEVFLINGREHKITYSSKNFYASCTAASLDENIWPSFPTPVTFETVALWSCTSPRAYTSFTAALKSLNITASISLRLMDLPSNTILSAETLAGVPVKLELAAAPGVTLTLKPNTLAQLNYLNSLVLIGVQYDHLPTKLEHLSLNRTGISHLEPNAFVNMTGILKIAEANLNGLSLILPKLFLLRISAPELYALSISDAWVGALGSWFLYGCSELETLVLRHLYKGNPYIREVPREMLKGLNWLWTFIMVDSDVVILPDDLFAYSPNIKMIDMSNNRLKVIPQELFSGLKDITELNLANNDIFWADLRIIGNITNLSRLIISGNRFKSLCPKGSKSMLSGLNLGYLDVSHTNLSHICADWLTMPELAVLNLTKNVIDSLNCAELNITRNFRRAGTPVIDVSSNPIDHFDCTKQDYEIAVKDPAPEQHVQLIIPYLTCDCDRYWLKRILDKRDVTIIEKYPLKCGTLRCG